jgi:hypothetical protein
MSARSVVLLCFMFLPTITLARADCGQILQHGIWEQREYTSDITNTNEFANWACSARARNNQRNTALDIPGYGTFGDTNSDNLTSNDCATNNGRYSLTQNTKVRMRTVAEALAREWSACMRANGSHASLLMRPNQKSFSIILKRITDSTDTQTLATVSTVGNRLNCTPSLTNPPIQVPSNGAERIISCETRDNRTGFDVNVRFSIGSDASFYIPAALPPPPPDPVSLLIGIYQCQPNPAQCSRNWMNAQIVRVNGVVKLKNEADPPSVSDMDYDQGTHRIIASNWSNLGGEVQFRTNGSVASIDWQNGTRWKR